MRREELTPSPGYATMTLFPADKGQHGFSRPSSDRLGFPRPRASARLLVSEPCARFPPEERHRPGGERERTRARQSGGRAVLRKKSEWRAPAPGGRQSAAILPRAISLPPPGPRRLQWTRSRARPAVALSVPRPFRCRADRAFQEENGHGPRWRSSRALAHGRAKRGQPLFATQNRVSLVRRGQKPRKV